jgi:predicted AAA+ superfamily ATPase
LWGARSTGKSTFLEQLYPQAVVYDLLKSDTYQRLLRSPHFFREEILALKDEPLHQPVIVGEIQKIPILLNEIHWLIEHKKIGFILCGSILKAIRFSVYSIPLTYDL